MSNGNGRANGHTSEDDLRHAIASAISHATQLQPLGSNPAPQQQPQGSTQAPQNSPMNAGTPRDSPPRTDAQYYRNGTVVSYRGDENMPQEDERVTIKFQEPEELVLEGKQAFDARMEVGGWVQDLRVQVHWAGWGAVPEV